MRIRHWLRRLEPRVLAELDRPALAWAKPWLDRHELFSFTRRPLARGLAIGLLCGLIPGPLQVAFTLVLCSLLRWAPNADPAVAADLVAKNREVFEAMRAIGGKRYSIGSVVLSHADWVGHFGLKWPFYLAEKLVHDPQNTLTPGQHIFSW